MESAWLEHTIDVDQVVSQDYKDHDGQIELLRLDAERLLRMDESAVADPEQSEQRWPVVVRVREKEDEEAADPDQQLRQVLPPESLLFRLSLHLDVLGLILSWLIASGFSLCIWHK